MYILKGIFSREKICLISNCILMDLEKIPYDFHKCNNETPPKRCGGIA